MKWMILYGTVFSMFVVLFFLSGRTKKKRKPAGRNPFENMGRYLYDALWKKNIFRGKQAEKDYTMLYPGINPERQVQEFYIHKIALALLLLFIGDAAAMCFCISSNLEGTLSEGTYIRRNLYGEGETEVNLQAEMQEEGQIQKEDFTIKVGEQKYEKEEIKKLAEEAASLLPSLILGENTSQDEIRGNLNLVQSIEGYPFHISWESDNYELVYSDGAVINETVLEPGEIVNLTAVISYEDYNEEQRYSVCICPPIHSEKELRRMKIAEALHTEEEESRHENKMILPATLDGIPVYWKEKRQDSSHLLLVFLGILAVLSYAMQDNRLHEKVKERERQMLLDYPGVVSKLTLYISAGMTIRNAFQKTADNYDMKKRGKPQHHYVYEEMLLSSHELNSGISESTVYEQFGKRCRLPPYTRLSNLLVQNLRKGSNHLLTALAEEAEDAFEERKNTARKLGEEAGTKLLLPMMLMLGIVMLLIMIPAYSSFSI